MDPARKNFRNMGAVLALSTPISGIFTFAIVAVILGEQRLEDASGQTPLGLLAYVLPAFIGLGMVAWSYSNIDLPDSAGVGSALLVMAALCFALGVWATVSVREGDASIGGGLLIVLAAGLGVAGIFSRRRQLAS